MLVKRVLVNELVNVEQLPLGELEENCHHMCTEGSLCTENNHFLNIMHFSCTDANIVKTIPVHTSKRKTLLLLPGQ